MASTPVPPRTPTSSPASGPATIPRRITAADFATPDADLVLAYPCAFDATRSTGLGPLRKALPDWVDALLRGRSSNPAPTPNTPLADLLRWGTTGCFPADARGLGAATKRRRSLAQLMGLADDRSLGSIGADDVVALGVAYRASRPRRPGAQVSADLTELRHLLNQARATAGLPSLVLPSAQVATALHSAISRAAWPAFGDRQPSRPRGIAKLGTVATAMRIALTIQRPRKRGGPPLQVRWLAAYLALQLALPIGVTRILGLRRSNFAPDRVIVPVGAQAGAIGQTERYGLPEWASDALNVALPGWSSLPPDALLFPGRRGRPRTDLARVLAIVRQASANLATLTPSAVRRLGQTVHRRMGGPRGVVRASMGALSSVETDFDLYFASEQHAANVVRSWPRMLEPPGGEGGSLPARARAGCAPSKPEFDPLRTAEPPRAMPASCDDQARLDEAPKSPTAVVADSAPTKAASLDRPSVPTSARPNATPGPSTARPMPRPQQPGIPAAAGNARAGGPPRPTLPGPARPRPASPSPQPAPQPRHDPPPKKVDVRGPPSRDPKPTRPIAVVPAWLRKPPVASQAGTSRARVQMEEWPGDDDLRDRRRGGGR